eukprot:3362828-Rhodomonas_salina.2
MDHLAQAQKMMEQPTPSSGMGRLHHPRQVPPAPHPSPVHSSTLSSPTLRQHPLPSTAPFGWGGCSPPSLSLTHTNTLTYSLTHSRTHELTNSSLTHSRTRVCVCRSCATSCSAASNSASRFHLSRSLSSPRSSTMLACLLQTSYALSNTALAYADRRPMMRPDQEQAKLAEAKEAEEVPVVLRAHPRSPVLR